MVIETMDTPGGLPDVFKDTSVLISGGTGFMGKVLTEKLLRSCPDIKNIYLLIREKKGKNFDQRLEEIFNDPLFSVVEKEYPKFRYKVSGIPGDIAAPGLGLSPEDREKIIQEVGIVFHGAATVRFDEKLKIAFNINIRGTREMLALAKDMKNLKAFVHISTAYANCHLDRIDEKLYEGPIDHKRLEQIVTNVDDDELLEALLPKLLSKWPNTYAYTKAVAEQVVREFAGNLPVSIFRPAIVVGTAYEPVIGWTDNVYGPTGIVVGAGCGVLRTLQADLTCDANIVPVDMCVNALIACAWECVLQRNNSQVLPTNQETEPEKPEDPKIYNYVSTVEKPLKWGNFKQLIEVHGTSVPTIKAMWYYFLVTTKYRFLSIIFSYLLHYFPALIIDSAAKLTGKESPNLYQIYSKIDKFSTVLTYFATRKWVFTNQNVQNLWLRLTPEDQAKFNFEMKKLDWDHFFYNYIRGLRVYLLKDEMSTLPDAMVRWKRFYWAHQVVKVLLGLLVFRVALFVLQVAYSFLLA
uniref:Fatty acyl-CoA reductase n=1 Tax=Nilaparvata lugens TaxID=108931 RepID=A0A3Q8G169_NILLU|nr:fatty acyl-CoA reductase [Nilaparvata lugens]